MDINDQYYCLEGDQSNVDLFIFFTYENGLFFAIMFISDSVKSSKDIL